MISTNQMHVSNEMQYFEDDESCFVVTFSCHLGHVVYSDLKVKTAEIVMIWLVNIYSTEHDQ